MNTEKTTLTKEDEKHLRRCLELAREAFEAGDAPFGSLLVMPDGIPLSSARNKSHHENPLAHPELELTRWVCNVIMEEKRKDITMYTSGEHCPMCAAAHGWAGLGTIVYLSSAKQLVEWRREAGAPEPPIRFIPVEDIIPDITVRGPATGTLLQEIKDLQMAYFKKQIEKE